MNRNTFRAAIAGVGLATVILANPAQAQSARPARPELAVSCKLIHTAAQLQAMRNDLAANYCLANDIDASSIANFAPVGRPGAPFTGSFFGNHHVIRNLRIKNTANSGVGLFGSFSGSSITDVALVNVNVESTASGATVGSLVGLALGVPNSKIVNATASGNVICGADNNVCGGLVGEMVGYTLVSSSSAVNVSGAPFVGGLIGFSFSTVADSFSVGDVACIGSNCDAGGLVGAVQGPVIRSFAAGRVAAGQSSNAGGLIGASSARVSQSAALGAVRGGNFSNVGGLIGFAANANSLTEQSFSIAPVNGAATATLGGLIGAVGNGVTVINSFWDMVTSARSTSGGGSGLTTEQLRAALPAGFDPAVWAITPTLSYPFLNDPDLAFNAPLATVVVAFQVNTFLPISQLDISQYRIKPVHEENAALAAVYTMIARAVGSSLGVGALKNAKIDTPFWHDQTQATTFSGPITTFVTLGAFKPIAPVAGLDRVAAQIAANRLVILRGSYTKANGQPGTHWMLATLDTKDANGTVTTIVANDPWTGEQIEIDPHTKKVLSNFPLRNFIVNGYQPVTIRPVS
jgi:hypothetical protein